MVQWRRAHKRFLAVWRSNNAFELIDDVALRRAQLVAGGIGHNHRASDVNPCPCPCP